MLFQAERRRVGAIGSKNSKIAIIGESPGWQEERAGEPFVGEAGSLLSDCLHMAKLTRNELYITNTIKEKPIKDDKSEYYKENNRHQGRWTERGQEFVDELYGELQDVKANILVAVGKLAFFALCGDNRITQRRGYIIPAVAELNYRKVIPIIHPAASIRGNYIYRYYITRDLTKARNESEFPEIRRPVREIILPRSTSDKLLWLDEIAKWPSVSFDIEVSLQSFQVTCISFADSPNRSISISIQSIPTLYEEISIWLKIAEILENPKTVKIGQNIAAFDGPFLARQCNILLQGPIQDTMIAHHIIYPDFLKSLAFLGSCYAGAQEYWKDSQWKDPRDE